MNKCKKSDIEILAWIALLTKKDGIGSQLHLSFWFNSLDLLTPALGVITELNKDYEITKTHKQYIQLITKHLTEAGVKIIC